MKKVLLTFSLVTFLLCLFMGGSAFAVAAPITFSNQTPVQDASVNNARPIISVKITSTVPLSQIKFSLNGADKTPDIVIVTSPTSTTVSYLPEDYLEATNTPYTAKVSVNNGAACDEWNFTVRAPKLSWKRVSPQTWFNKSLGLLDVTYRLTNNGSGTAKDIYAYNISTTTPNVIVWTKSGAIEDIAPGASRQFTVRVRVKPGVNTFNLKIPVTFTDEAWNAYNI